MWYSIFHLNFVNLSIHYIIYIQNHDVLIMYGCTVTYICNSMNKITLDFKADLKQMNV